MKKNERKNYGLVREEFPEADTSYGRISGDSKDGAAIFRNIPYGCNISAEKRFLPADDPKKWEGVLDCKKTGPKAFQRFGSGYNDKILGDYSSGGETAIFDLNNQVPSEECLNLNITTPGIDDKKRPVMVYVHGGGFSVGNSIMVAGSYRFVNEEDVVLVGVNHRLNIFGYIYLSHLDPKYEKSGVVGMLDFVKALEWVRDNIANFGGDPDNVTLFGESGGAIKINTLMSMPEAKGLFKRCILESGSLRMFRSVEEAIEDTDYVLDKLGIARDELWKLTQVPAGELYELASAMVSKREFCPVIDGVNLKIDSTDDLWASDLADDIPIVVGSAECELTSFYVDKLKYFDLSWDEVKSEISSFTYGMEDADIDKLIKAYREMDSTFSPTDVYFRIISDDFFCSKAQYQCEAKARKGKAPAYRFSFAYDTKMFNGRLRAFHAGELSLAMRLVFNGEAEGLSRNLADSFANFAKTGDPSFDGTEWKNYTLNDRATLLFDLQSKAVNDPYKKARQAWAKIFEDKDKGDFVMDSFSYDI